MRGTAAAEGFVRAVLQQQVPALDPYDDQGMLGALFDHTPVVDGYTYLDLPRGDTLASFPDLILPNCFERVYVGYVRPTGGPVTPMEPDDLGLVIYDLAGVCVDDGYVDQVVSGVEAQGWAPDEIGGVAVWRDATNVVWMSDDVLIHMHSEDPQTFDDLAPFVEPFLVDQPA